MKKLGNFPKKQAKLVILRVEKQKNLEFQQNLG
jgi:hypothetical protein